MTEPWTLPITARESASLGTPIVMFRKALTVLKDVNSRIAAGTGLSGTFPTFAAWTDAALSGTSRDNLRTRITGVGRSAFSTASNR